MHIAIVTTYPPSSGTLTEYAFYFIEALRHKPGIDAITLLVDELPDGGTYSAPAAGGVPLRIIPCWRFNSVTNPVRILNTVQNVKPDLVFFNIQFASFGRSKVAGGFGLVTPALLRASGIPTAVLLHNLVDTIDLGKAGFSGSSWSEKLLRSAGTALTHALLKSNIVAVTMPSYLQLLEQRYNATNAVLTPHGSFDTQPYKAEPVDGPVRIITFGKFGTYKRVEELIEAYDSLSGAELPPLELVIAGADSPNAAGYLASVRARYAHVKGLRFTGYVPEPDVPRLFQESSIVVLPYAATTGSSGVLSQSSSYGRAVVLPQLGDLAELMESEGYVGETFIAGDSASLAGALRRLICDPERRQTIGMHNYRVARSTPMVDVVDLHLHHWRALLRKPQQHEGSLVGSPLHDL